MTNTLRFPFLPLVNLKSWWLHRMRSPLSIQNIVVGTNDWRFVKGQA